MSRLPAVLRDLIAYGRIPVTLLTVVKRQDEGSPMVDAAHAINRGELPRAQATSAGDLCILRAKARPKTAACMRSSWWSKARCGWAPR